MQATTFARAQTAPANTAENTPAEKLVEGSAPAPGIICPTPHHNLQFTTKFSIQENAHNFSTIQNLPEPIRAEGYNRAPCVTYIIFCFQLESLSCSWRPLEKEPTCKGRLQNHWSLKALLWSYFNNIKIISGAWSGNNICTFGQAMYGKPHVLHTWDSRSVSIWSSLWNATLSMWPDHATPTAQHPNLQNNTTEMLSNFQPIHLTPPYQLS